MPLGRRPHLLEPWCPHQRGGTIPASELVARTKREDGRPPAGSHSHGAGGDGGGPQSSHGASCSSAPEGGGAALNLSSEGRALGACGQVGARVDTVARMWPSLPSPGGACRPPVSCEQGREESELGRPGDGWELLVGGPPLQQEQGKCPRRVAGAPWPRVCGTGAVGELSPAPPLAQDPQAGSKASEPRGTHWLPGPSAVQCPRQGTGHPRVPSWATSRASVTTPESFSSLPRGDGVVSYPLQPGPARRP